MKSVFKVNITRKKFTRTNSGGCLKKLTELFKIVSGD